MSSSALIASPFVKQLMDLVVSQFGKVLGPQPTNKIRRVVLILGKP